MSLLSSKLEASAHIEQSAEPVLTQNYREVRFDGGVDDGMGEEAAEVQVQAEGAPLAAPVPGECEPR